ncbi:mycothiol transferase [Allorhizocola rhizosphaerae]|uniref:mycothiol transferase n=1 Tax=Allorhizocola rhizosphaerae TaxID=1872709 RepID=UPI000E3BFAC2|nr:DinB family protein [Allorhizocola rhizosphaerae]
MDVSDLLTEAFDRLPDLVRSAVHGLTPDELRWAPAEGANSVGWLVWHLTRIQDDHVAEILAQDQVWVQDGWAGRFGLDPDPANTGYGHTPKQVAAVRPESAQVLVEYYNAVAARTRELLLGLTAKDLDRVVDEAWDPPVTLGVRLVSVLNDDDQHVGQAAYVRGLVRRSRRAKASRGPTS